MTAAALPPICPLCQQAAVSGKTLDNQNGARWMCTSCGTFDIDGMAFAAFFRQGITLLDGRRYVLSGLARAEQGRGETLWIDADLCARVQRGEVPEPGVMEKLRLLVKWFREASGHPGSPVPLGDEMNYPAAFCRNADEWKYFREEAAKRGLLEWAVNGAGLVVTTAGWEWLEHPGAHLPSSGSLLPTTGIGNTPSMDSHPDWDVFISHASEDKPFVRALAAALKTQRVRVWLDQHELTMGDSLSQKIDHGLARSRHGIVVLSKAFFEKHWPQKELAGLVQREVAGRKVILPIWHGVVHADVVQFSPTLADKLAANSDHGVDAVVAKVLAAIGAAGAEIAATAAPDPEPSTTGRSSHGDLAGLLERRSDPAFSDAVKRLTEGSYRDLASYETCFGTTASNLKSADDARRLIKAFLRDIELLLHRGGRTEGEVFVFDLPFELYVAPDGGDAKLLTVEKQLLVRTDTVAKYQAKADSLYWAELCAKRYRSYIVRSTTATAPAQGATRYGHRMRAHFQGPCSVRKGHEIEIHRFIGPKAPGSGKLRILKMVDLTDDITYVSDIYNTMMTIQPADVVVRARVAGAISQDPNQVEFDVEMTNEEFAKFEPHAQPQHSAWVR